MLEVIPAILTNSPEEARSLIGMCEGVASRVQVDVIDGEFVENKTVFPEVFSDDIYVPKIDFHLMVKEPIHWVERCIRGNADRIIGQIELMSDQTQFCKLVIEKNILVGLGIDLNTSVDELEEEALSYCDVVLVMSVNAGFGGQEYDTRALEKIEKLNSLRTSMQYHFAICDDGGVTIQNENKIAKAGANEVAIGKRLFEGDLRENIDHFKKASLR